MGVFNFGDPANRRPAWLVAPWPTRRGDRGAPSSHPAPLTPAAPRPVAQGVRVLVADDNPGNLMMASEMLSLWGIEPLLAADGIEAVAVARERALALILMDLQMPVLDGLGATMQIRRNELESSCARVPIVAYSSSALSGNRSLLQHFGLDDWLAKPCETSEMHECLARWCPQLSLHTASVDLRVRDWA